MNIPVIITVLYFRFGELNKKFKPSPDMNNYGDVFLIYFSGDCK